jgi:serine/threonine protein phosphatase 1
LSFLQKPWFFSVRGNHERYFSKTFKNGYPSTSYERGGIEKTLHWVFNQNADYFKKLSEALAALPLAMEIATPQGPVGIVHGNVPRGMSWQHFTARISAGDKEVRGAATEGRSRITAGDLQGVTGIRHIFSGHTVQEQGPRALGNCFYIDTGAYQADLYPEKNYALTLADLRVTAEDINKSQNNRRDRCIIILPGGQKP